MSDPVHNPLSGPDAEFAALLTSIRACRICRDTPRFGQPLPHEPRPVIQASPQARICIVGQAPGARVHASGRPFTDASGDRLRDWLGIGEADFYDAEKVALIPMGFCFPGNDTKGGDLPPRRECAPAWHDTVFAHLPNIELMLLVGQYAQRSRLDRTDTSGGLTRTVQEWRQIYHRPGPPRTIPLPHPSWRNSGWLKQNAWFEAELLPVLRADIAGLLG
ncbi:MAG: uracil glycosylase superfamily protein [Devosia sp.]|uniref:uracil-DNA glycosylase family protein n=1 Tax=Devosia sp. TaxID=1871048 RepID=UPI0026205E14|nr:uracil-DNA glycosylase family protein [Devosia sp.]MDB5529446.1 uracil glycosylase superfamily protein [Devosia sp.]